MAKTQIKVDPGTTTGTSWSATDSGGNIVPITAAAYLDASDVPIAVTTSAPLPIVQTGTPALPTGAATSALQTTGNTSLATIATNLPAQGQALAAASTPVVLTAAQITTLTPPTNTGYATSSLQTTGNTSLSSIDGKTPALGQALAAASVPVVLTAAQITTLTPPTTVTVTGTVTANAGTNLNTSLLALESGGNLATIAGTVTSSVLQANVKQINGVTPLMGNGTTGTGSQRVTIASDNTVLPAVGAGATGSAVPANAVYNGVIATTSNPSAATAGNTVGIMGDKLGKVVTVGAVRDLKGNQVTTITASTSETTVVTAVASTFLDVYGCVVTNTSATATTVAFKDSTAGTTQYNVAVPAGDTRGFMLPAGDGIKQGTVNNNWTATSSVSVSSLVITMLYVKNI